MIVVHNHLGEILDKLEEIFYLAAEKFLSKGVQSYSHKSTNDLLTDVDINMQEYIIGKIKEFYPEILIYAEEKSNTPIGNELTISLDPLDGTCNFSTGIPFYGVQAAIFEKKDIVASIIYLPQFSQIFRAIKGRGVTLNHAPLWLNGGVRFEDAIIEISDFYHNIEIPYEIQFKLIQELQTCFLKTRLFGAACWDFAMLATGKVQAYLCYYHEIWDIAPGLLIVQELGMQIGALTGEYHLGCSSLIVGADKTYIDHIRGKYKELV